MSTLSTVPPNLEIAVTETRTWPLDVTPTVVSMAVGAPTTPTVTVIDPTTSQPVSGAVAGSPTVSGNVITATINGGALTAGRTYRMVWTAVCSGQTLAWVTDRLSVVA